MIFLVYLIKRKFQENPRSNAQKQLFQRYHCCEWFLSVDVFC